MSPFECLKEALDFCAGLIYYISVEIKAEEMLCLPLPDSLKIVLHQNGGIITTAQGNAAGVSNERLRLLEKSGELERAARGIYISPDEFTDKMYIAQLSRPKIIYSHETALFLHGLTDRDPVSYTVTVPSDYNAKSLRRDRFTVFAVKRELHGIGVERLTTMFGHAVAAYGLERTICDCIRSRNQMDIAIVTDAMKRYAKRSDKNLNTLMQMAEVFRVVKPLRSYMEVLL